MLDTFESLPLGATTAIVAAISALAVVVVLLMLRMRLKWAVVVAVPLVASYSIYWLPVWLHRSTDIAELEAWQFLFVAIWGGARIGLSVLLAQILSNTRRRKSEHV